MLYRINKYFLFSLLILEVAIISMYSMVNFDQSEGILLFILSIIITGLLEYLTGFVLHKFMNIRLWDYNTEIWNFGNIDGYICLRSILFFGLSSLFLVYILVPILKRIIINKSLNKVLSVSLSLLLIFFISGFELLYIGIACLTKDSVLLAPFITLETLDKFKILSMPKFIVITYNILLKK